MQSAVILRQFNFNLSSPLMFELKEVFAPTTDAHTQQKYENDFSIFFLHQQKNEREKSEQVNG